MIGRYRKTTPIVLFAILLSLAVSTVVFADQVRGVASSGGTAVGSTSLTLKSTVGNISSHEGSSAVDVQSGYWNKRMALGGCDCIPGDADNNGAINVLDIIYLIDYKFKSGPEPLPYAICSGDVDCNCIVNVIDIIALIDYKFKDGPAPCDCSQWNGGCSAK